tara:strand:- start:616 stop:912 length:297 start_codon:yes stop_codon:yes gene_type:complete
MKHTVTLNYFRNWFTKHKPNYFSYVGLECLYDFLIQIEESGKEQEFDPVNFCIIYTEYENIEEFWTERDEDDYPNIDSIKEMTTLIRVGNKGFIIQNF